MAELAAWEYVSIADAKGRAPTLVLIAIAVLSPRPSSARSILPVIGLCSSSAAGVQLSLTSGAGAPGYRLLVFALLYIGLTLATVPLLWAQPDGSSLLIFLFCVVWTGDIAALYVGRNFGRQKLAPQISPNKSWEGSAASLAGSLLIAAALVASLAGEQAHPSFFRSAGSLAGVGRGLESLRPGGRFG